MRREFVFVVLILTIGALGCISKTYTSVPDVVLDKKSKGKTFDGMVEVFNCLDPDEEGQWCRVGDYPSYEEEIWISHRLNQTFSLGDVIVIKGKIGEASIKIRNRYEKDILYIEVESVMRLE